MGLDPGFGRLGYGLVRSNGNTFEKVDYGVIETKPNLSSGYRLMQIQDKLQELLDLYKIDFCMVEQVFFRKNLTTGIMLIQARGVVVLTLARNKIEYAEISPTALKKTLTGNGMAPKKQMQQMTSRLLGLMEIPQPDDAADALGLGICAVFNDKHRKARKDFIGKIK